MKRNLILCLTAGLLAWTAPAVLAQSTNAPATSENQSSHRREDRKELLRILDLNPQDLKSLTPAERRDKIKEATDQKLAALEQKKDAGTITESEQHDLTFLKTHLRHHAKATSNN